MSNQRTSPSTPILDKSTNVAKNRGSTSKPDKRTQRTRLRLQASLHELLKSGDYELITVDEICERAAIGRSTFYTHFKSKDDLKRSAMEHLHAELLRAQIAGADGDRTFAFSRALFDHAKQHVKDYQSLARGRGGRVVLTTIKQIVSELVRNELAAKGCPSRTLNSVEFETAYIAGALMSVLTRWLAEGAQADVAVVNTMFVEMSRGALSERAMSEHRSAHRVSYR